MGLEVVSPAMYATDGAFKEVEEVANMLRRTFRTAVPPSCGLHVHVGAGTDFLNLRTIKRMAAFFWAGDLLFQQMHPLNRRYNEYCLGPRVKSKVGLGRETGPFNKVSADANKVDTSTDDTNTDDTNTDSANKVLCSIQSYINSARPLRLLTNFRRTFPRNKHVDTPSQEEMDACTNGCIVAWPHEHVDPVPGVHIIKGAIEISHCSSFDAVHAIMSAGSRGAYSFENYSDDKQKEEGTPRTVEFRQAAGSLDGHWVSTYAQLCVGIARFAEDASEGRVWRLIDDCHHAETKNTGYDVIDLLLDLGLTREAKVVQYRLETGSLATENLQRFSTMTGLPHYSASKLTMARCIGQCNSSDSDELVGGSESDEGWP
ncbi:hypothetical protein GGR54DRAFT_599426 [Hypoxylon sp. NC1633]|nr:hypothetical protein GGR54DRAFT_599426 [Hypoxylon sp. NC1633]